MLTVFPDFIRSAAAFVVVLGVLVFVHELGHYLAARWRGVHVEAFSIGFGRAITSWTDRHGTVWKLAWLPLGGYVKLHGQERPQDVADEVRARWIPGQTFHDKSVLSRAIVVAAGPVANFLLAMVLFAGLFIAIGTPGHAARRRRRAAGQRRLPSGPDGERPDRHHRRRADRHVRGSAARRHHASRRRPWR